MSLSDEMVFGAASSEAPAIADKTDQSDQSAPKNTDVPAGTLTVAKWEPKKTDQAKKPDVNIWQVHCSTQESIGLRTKIGPAAALKCRAHLALPNP